MRHQDPTFIKRRLQKSPEAAGKNFMSFICCNYWLVKTFAEPFLNTSHTVQTLVHGSTDCLIRSRSRLNCADTAEVDEEESQISRYEDERKGRNSAFSSSTSTCIARTLHYTAIFLAYGIILIFIYASLMI